MDISSSSVRLRSPGTTVILGISNCGKTEVLKTILLSEKETLDFPVEKVVIFCFEPQQKAYAQLKQQFGSRICFIKGYDYSKLEELEIDRRTEGMQSTVVIVFDDTLEDLLRCKMAFELVAKWTHHKSVSSTECGFDVQRFYGDIFSCTSF